MASDNDNDYATAVAVIGMSGRFPGADSAAQLWENSRAGIKGLREITDDELRAAGVTAGTLADPHYIRIGGPVADVEWFDAGVFGITPREAESMDPQHRIFLECAWEAFESAGYCPTDVPGQVAVFGGCGFPDYIIQNIWDLQLEPGGNILMAAGNERDSLTNTVSYKLGLRGPAVTVQTFCSTSLVSVHLACQSLLTFDCDLALAGGVYIALPHTAGYLYEPGSIASADGVVRSFDAEANGTVLANGAGVVVLKRMSEAIADGDVIHAVIIGSAANNDGRVRAGYTAPGVDGQAEVIELALDVAGAKPESIGYVECHATGTVLGDSIELAAMARVFNTPRKTPAVLGTLKASIGHMDRASGAGALMRAVHVVKHGILPGQPNFATPNPALAAAADQFRVLTEEQVWPEGPEPRRAGVSSFGLGGTNAHVVLQEPPVRDVRPARPGPHLLTFSALNHDALTAYTEKLREFLAAHEDVDPADVAYTLQMSRGGFALRRAIVVGDREDAVAALADSTRWIDDKTQRRNPKVRLTAAEDVPEQWWTELTAAIPAAGRSAGGLLEALGAWLSGLGVRIDASETAEEVVVGPEDGYSAGEWLLATVARLWQGGSKISWPDLHDGRGRRVELPTYQFQRRRYWVEAKPRTAVVPTGRSWDRSQWTYLPSWRRLPVPITGLDAKVREAGPWLVLAGEERGEALAAKLHEFGAEVTVVRPDDVESREDMARVVASLPKPPRAVVHGFSLASPEASRDADPAGHFDAEQERGLHSVLSLAAALVDKTGAAPRAEVVLLTSGASDVIGADLRHPEHAGLAALAPTLAQENPRVRCRAVDIDDVTAVVPALAATVHPYAGPTAVRSGEVWLRVYEPCPTAEIGPENRSIQDGDTILITGGLGDVGLVLSRHLASAYSCKLVLTARTPLPPREQWQDFLENVPEDGHRAARHIRNIRDLEARGAEVLALSADAADPERMRAVVDAAIERFGRIDVVLHGAGVQDITGFDYAHQLGRVSCDGHMNSKVRGFHVLQEVLGDQALDRRITMSSLSAVLGGMTLGAYGAANAALDAYTRVARREGRGRWVTVNWDTWNIDPDRLAGHGPGVNEYAMLPKEGADIFERALAAADRVGHLTISTGPLNHRIKQWVTGDLHEVVEEETRERDMHPRPELNTPFVAPRPGTETVLSEIWAKVLGIEPIGTADNFFELGGHSLMAINLTARIRGELDAAIPITTLLENPTVGQLAVLIDTAKAAGESPAESHAASEPASAGSV